MSYCFLILQAHLVACAGLPEQARHCKRGEPGEAPVPSIVPVWPSRGIMHAQLAHAAGGSLVVSV